MNFWLAFRPLLLLTDLNGDWTIADDNPVVTRFFKKLLELQGATEQGLKSGLPHTNKHWDLLKECRYYVYQIRNNIFHGSKRLGDVWDENHKKRIGIYQLFLACLVNAAFRALDRVESTSAYIFPAVDIPMGNGQKLHLSRDQQIRLGLVLKTLARKIGGQILRHGLGTELAQPKNQPEKSCLGSTH